VPRVTSHQSLGPPKTTWTPISDCRPYRRNGRRCPGCSSATKAARPSRCGTALARRSWARPWFCCSQWRWRSGWVPLNSPPSCVALRRHRGRRGARAARRLPASLVRSRTAQARQELVPRPSVPHRRRPARNTARAEVRPPAAWRRPRSQRRARRPRPQCKAARQHPPSRRRPPRMRAVRPRPHARTGRHRHRHRRHRHRHRHRRRRCRQRRRQRRHRRRATHPQRHKYRVSRPVGGWDATTTTNRSVALGVDQGLLAEQGGEIPGLRADVGQAMRGEPATDVLRVTGEEEGAPWVRDHVDHLR
jgi:hypothetical protein